jgi:DNA-binding beta-propeller fold protein YncE
MKLLRLGSKHEPWVLGDQEMRAFSETGELDDRRIPLKKPAKSEEAGKTGASEFMDGFPGETLSLGDNHAAIQISNKNGGSRHKVALIDLKKLQVDAIIPTMSASEIAGIRTSRFLGAYVMSMATGGSIIFTPNWIRNESLAARPDGRYLFALDLEGHVVTVIDVQTASIVRRIRVNSTVTKLQVSTDGKYLNCLGKTIQQINLETNNLEK